ncbi:MAG TPA: AIR synthase related protein, partial [Acidobacteriaceae bacterium]|nr:AIR synthase related protein [Acidobacteriaceae bacterium]
DLKKLLASPNICSKRWVYEQYDSMVQTNTVQGPGGEAGVMRIKGTGTRTEHHETKEQEKKERGLAMALDGNGRWCWLDPKLGAMHAVAEAARKVACTGATPVAATNCLNFGNPEKPEIMAQLSAAIDGIAEACTALGTPITGGNVSLYNETRGEGIYPTPVVGVVGIIDDATKAVGSDFARTGDVLLLVDAGGAAGPSALQNLGSSEYAKVVLNSQWGNPPSKCAPFLGGEAQLHRRLAQLASERLVHAALDVADGGLAVALAKGCFAHATGVDVLLQYYPGEPGYIRLFGEEAVRVVVACAPDNVARIEEIFRAPLDPVKDRSVGIWKLGSVTPGSFRIQLQQYQTAPENRRQRGEIVTLIDTNIAALRAPFSTALESQLAAEVNA